MDKRIKAVRLAIGLMLAIGMSVGIFDVVGPDGPRATFAQTDTTAPTISSIAITSDTGDEEEVYLGIEVTAEDDTTTQTYTVTRLVSLQQTSTDATLSGLSLSDVNFGAFASATTSYTADVANSVSLTNVTPTLNDSDASYVIKLGGVTDADGTVTLAVGSNVITVVVTAEDDSTTKTYSVTVTRAATSISAPDLAVPFVYTFTNPFGYSPAFTLGVTVSNKGSGSSGSTTLRYYRSADSTITNGDTEVGTDAVGGLAASGRSREGIDLTAPSAPGTYYYGACVDAVSDESDTTNNCSPGIAFVVPAVTSTDATLSGLSLSGVNFGTFASGTTAYSAQVANSVSQTTVTPTVNHSGARYVIKLGGVTDADGVIPLAVGSNVITIEVTAEDDTTTRTYTLTVSRLVSLQQKATDASLSGLTLSDVNFGTFSSATTSYSAQVANSVTQTTVTPTVNDSDASYVIKLGGVTDSDGTVSLAVGSNVITVEVTAEDDSTKKTYSVTVTRAAAPVSAPDLTVPYVSTFTNLYGYDPSFTLGVNVINQGSGSSGSTTLRYYRSADSTITNGDTEVGTDAVGGLAASGRSREGIDLTAPSAPGTYYYGACVDAVPDESDTTNNCSPGIAFVVPAVTSTDATLSGLSLSGVNFGTFASGTTAYSAQVANSVSQTTVTPTVNHSGARYVIKLGGVTDADGVIPLAVGSNVITIEVTAEDDTTTRTYTLTVSRLVSLQQKATDASLSGLTLSDVNFGTFSSATTSYSARVANSVTQTTVTPTVNDSGARHIIKLGGVTDSDRTISLAVGSNVITVEVTAEDGETTKTYTVTVTRSAPPSSDATLSALTLSRVDFGTFSSATTSYSAQVANSVTQTTVTPTVNDSGARHIIKLGGVTDSDGTVSLAVGSNVITVEVTAEDGETTKTYTVTVTRAAPPSSDATLSGLSLSDVNFGTFASGTTRYSALVANSVSRTTVTPTVNDSGARHIIKLGGVTDSDGTVSLAVGSNVITVEVTAEDDSTKKTYSVTVTRAAAPVSAPDLTVPYVSTFTNLYGYDPSFTLGVNVINQGSGSSGSTTLRYYRSADSTITNGDTEVGTDAVGGLAASGRSVEGIDLTAPSAPGTYYYGACVDAVPDESDTTNNCSPGIAFMVPAVTSTDATLSGLSLSGVNFGTFASGTTAYSVQIANSVSQTTVTPIVNHSGASYVIKLGGETDSDGTVSLTVGKNVITVEVTAEDDSATKTYTVNVTRAEPPSIDATLKGLTLSRVDFGTFDSTTTSYSAQVANSVTETNVTPTVNHSGASYVIKFGGETDSDGTISLAVGSNVIKVEVTAGDGQTTKTYTVTVTRAAPPSSDATLKALSLSGINLGTFRAATTSYSVQVANSVSQATVTPTLNDSGASYVIKLGGVTDADGTVSLAVGSNVITVVVTAEDTTTTRTYTVTVTRAAPTTPEQLSSDAALSALTLSGVNFGTFDSTTISYSAQVANSVTQTTVTPTVNDSGARHIIKLGGVTDSDRTISLAVGSNVITVEVTAEDGETTKTYTVTVTRSAPPSSDATLSALTLSRVDFGTFSSATTSYSAQVANSVTQTTVTPTVNDSGARHIIKLGGVTDSDRTISLAVGSNVITVEVTAEDDSTKKTYSVTVTRSAPPSSDATLSALTLSRVDFGTFSSATTSYSAQVANSVTQTTVTPVVNDSGARHIIKLGGVTDSDGTVSLAVGSNVITVEVTAEDDSTKKTYSVTVTRAAAPVSAPDLTVPYVSTFTNLYGYDPSFTLGVNVINQGSGSSGSTTLRYYRSADSTITNGDTEVGTDAVGGLAASGRSVEGIDLTAPSAPGTYYYGACVDAVPDESDTTNNCSPGIAFMVPAVSSTDATLTALTLSGIDFGTFDSTTVSYSTQVSNSVTQTTVRPTVNDSGASYVIMLDGVTDADGTVSLAVGSNVITVVVTAEDGHTTRIYTVRITRDSVSEPPEPETSAGICDRTSEVQEAILGKLNEGLDAPEISDCSEVTDEDLGGIIGSLILSNMDISALKSGDFQGLSGLTSLYLDHNNLTTLPEGIFQGLDSLDILWLHFNPGSPFSLTMELEQQGEDSVLAKVVEGTPFDMVITLSSDGGTLSSTEITVVGGDIESEAVVVTADEGSTEVTVSVASSDIPGTGYTNFFGLVWQEAEPLVITFEAEIVTPELVLGELPTDDPPVNFRITSYDDSQVSLSWEIPNNRGITVYELKRYDHDGTEFASSNWSVSGTVAGGDSVTEFSTGLTADSRYRYDLVLKSDTGTVIIEKSLEVRTRAVGAAALSSDVTLSVLSLSRVELDPVFTSAANSYTGNVASDVAQTTVTATPNDTAAGYIVKLGGAVDADGAVDLTPGRNVITVHVTAEDGVTTRIYTVVVTRAKTADALSSDATLRSLSLSGIDFGTFDPDTTTYTAQVINDVTQTTVTPVRNDVEAAHVIKVGGVEDADGDVSLAVGENVIAVEVTAEDGETTRTYTVTVTRDGAAAPDPEPDPTPDPEPADTCVRAVDADDAIAGSWDDTCLSEKNAQGGAGDRYARFYTFTLTEATDIVINLSSDEDTYLYLLNGHGKSGDTLHSNDDIAGGGVNLNSRLSVTLQAGDYTIEATTYSPETSGAFTLTIAGLSQAEAPAPDPQPEPAPDPEPEVDACAESVDADGTIEGSWDDTCLSDRAALSGTGDRYSRFYTFTLDESADVTITLMSDEDTYLYLLEGHGRNETVLYEEDDIDYPSNTNSRLAETLQAGDYTIEATTYYADKSGEFTLTIEGLVTSP